MSRPIAALVVGTRPQLIKAGYLQRVHGRRNDPFDLRVIDTNQHYDAALASAAATGLGGERQRLELDDPAAASQLDRLVATLRPVLSEMRPDRVLVIGDTNSTTAATLVATELSIPVLHIEAGLRSFDRTMPEERNRLIADHLSDRLFAPSAVAMAQLAAEGLANRSLLTGDVTYDLTLEALAGLGAQRNPLADVGSIEPDSPLPIVLATVHRPANVDDAQNFERVAALFEALANHAHIVCPAHPRVTAKYDLATMCPSVLVIEPLAHIDLLALISRSTIVLTDSGGIQRESFWLGRPCVTLRSETEWVETVESGHNTLAQPGDVDLITAVLAAAPAEPFVPPPVYGQGNAAELILDDIAASVAIPVLA